MTKIKTLSLSAITGFMLCALASCGSSPATVVNTLKNSTCGALSDFKLNGKAIQNPETNEQTFKAGDVLTFAATPAADYQVGMIKYQNANGLKVASSVVEDEKLRYSVTLAAGVNKITPSYDIDSTIDFVEKFKLPISDEIFTEVMKDPDQSTTYDLRTNGIEQMQTTYTDSGAFINYVDGDTTHFTTRNYGYTAKARYLGIDTPESTSEIEEWGKTASIYNKSQLSQAKHIIVHGQIEDGGYNVQSGKYEYTFNVTTDGNQRNLLYVWYSTKETPTKDDFKCLNLEMVYQGLSQGIGAKEKMGEYFYNYFEKANKSAQANERHQYTSAYHADTNYYYGAPVSLTLKQIYDTTTSEGADSPYNDKKTLYRVRGYVSRTIEGSFYFQDQPSYDQTNGLPEAYGMYVFTFAQTPIAPGDYVEVIGVLSDYGGTYQMQGISYHDVNPDVDRDTRIISRNHTIKPIEVTMDEFNTKKYPLVLTTITETMYAVDVVNSYGSTCDGGTEEINKYNTKYPFYNTSNKIVAFMTTEANKDASFSSLSATNMIRFQTDENILIKYAGSYAYSPKFFIGGSYNYNPKGAQYVNWNPEEHGGEENPYASETVTKTFERKSMSVTCISSGYTSTGGTKKHSAIIVNKADVKNLTNAQ